MRWLLALIVALSSLPALAADPTGAWRIDREQQMAQMNAMIEAMLADLPAETRPQMERMMRGMLDGMSDQIVGTATFEAGGAVTFARDDGTVSTGQWSDGGEVVEIQPDEPDAPLLRGRIDGDVMTVTMDLPPDMPPGLTMEQVWHRQ